MGSLPNLGALSLAPERGAATGAGIYHGENGGTVLVVCNSDKPFEAMVLVVEEKIKPNGSEWRYYDDYGDMQKEYQKRPGNEEGKPTAPGNDGAMWGPPGGFADARRDGGPWRQLAYDESGRIEPDPDKRIDPDAEKTFPATPAYRWRAAQRELVEELGVTDRDMNLEYICELCRQLNAQREALDARRRVLVEDKILLKAAIEEEEAPNSIAEFTLGMIARELQDIDRQTREIDERWTKEICKVCNKDGNNEALNVRPPAQYERIEDMRKQSQKKEPDRGYDWRRLLDDRRTLVQTWVNLALDKDRPKDVTDNLGPYTQQPNAVYALLLPYPAEEVEAVMLGLPSGDARLAARRASTKELSSETLGMDWTSLYELCNKDPLCCDAPSGLHFQIKLQYRSKAEVAPTYALRQKYATDTIERARTLWNMEFMQKLVHSNLEELRAEFVSLDLTTPATELARARLTGQLFYNEMVSPDRYQALLEHLQRRLDVQKQFKRDVEKHFKNAKASGVQKADLDFGTKLDEYKTTFGLNGERMYSDLAFTLRNKDSAGNKYVSKPWTTGVFPKTPQIDIVTSTGRHTVSADPVNIYKQLATRVRPFPTTQDAGGTANR